MAVGTVTLYSANKHLINIEDLLGATVKFAILDSGHTPDTTQTGHDTWSDVSADEIAAGNGYTAGGVSLTSLAKAAITGGYKFSSAAATWNATGSGIPAWRYIVAYVSGSFWGKTDPLLFMFIADTTPADAPATSAGNPLTINCPANGWFDVT